MKPGPELRSLPRWQRVLVRGIWVGLALLLVTPLVVTVSTAYPFTVGKALYARTVVEFLFALWVPLALANPAFRPPRSWLLILLGLGFAVSVLAAGFGINFERSVWSTYERMQGLVNAVHWLAFAVVLVSVVKHGSHWRVLFSLNLGVSVAMAVLAIGRFHGVEIGYLADVEERSWQISAAFGNSTLLGHYALLNCILAAGMAVWSFAAKPFPALWAGRSFWLAAAALNAWAMTLSGSLAALVAFVGASGGLALAYALFAHGVIARRVGLGGLAVLGTGAVLLATLFFVDNPLNRTSDNPLLRRLSFASVEGSTTQTRLAAWDAAGKGFADRPVLGWGPDNYIVPFGKHAAGFGATMSAHDYPHNEFMEEAATKGACGAAVYVAIWALTFVVVVRYARGRPGTDPPASAGGQALALFVGAALMAELLFKQTLFANVVGSLQYTLLLGFVVGLEAAMRPEGSRRWLPRASAVLASWLDRTALRATVVVVVLCACAAGMVSNVAIYAGANALLRFAAPAAPMTTLDETITAFPPMANYGRRLFFDDLANNWRRLRIRHSAEASRQLARADVAVEAAVAAEPDNWIVIHAIARLYRAVAATDPAYRDHAARYLQRSNELAPNIEVQPPPKP